MAIFFIVLCLSSCGKSTPQLKTDKYMDINKVVQTGQGRTVWVSSAKVSGNIFLPLIYMDTNDEIECSVELKLIDNTTGIAKTRSGHAIVVLNSKNVLLFFGDITSSSNGGVEFSIRSAIRDALTKF